VLRNQSNGKQEESSPNNVFLCVLLIDVLDGNTSGYVLVQLAFRVRSNRTEWRHWWMD